MSETPKGLERRARAERTTRETQIKVALDLDGSGRAAVSTGIGFFDHMLTLLAGHSGIDLEVQAVGDLHVDAHHTVEDCGIVLGRALSQALGDRAGITRYGTAFVPMDEALVMAVLDISGRPYLSFDMDTGRDKLGDFDTELVEEFMKAFASSAGLTLHIRKLAGKNAHHIIEAGFKALGRALRQAVQLDPRVEGVPSTKGVL